MGNEIIQWERTNNLLGKDIEERSETYEMIGYGADGKTYSGIGEYSCGELIKVDEIEEIHPT